ncbi:hypothetical protein GAPWK_2559 [Gilliamella apicola]|nr:hypothetical protein GAPWK_2559 [Gilliamella apicola]
MVVKNERILRCTIYFLPKVKNKKDEALSVHIFKKNFTA